MHLLALSSRALASGLLGILLVGLVGCGRETGSLFERRPSDETGIEFANTIVENDSLLNPLDFDYLTQVAGYS